jgi:hypothetical protein
MGVSVLAADSLDSGFEAEEHPVSSKAAVVVAAKTLEAKALRMELLYRMTLRVGLPRQGSQPKSPVFP